MSVARTLQHYGRGEGTDRLCAFSDGVFAIAITLLVLNLQVPQTESVQPGALDDAVWALRPQFAAYALSFAVIGMLWVAHHRMFALIQRHDTGLLWLNLLVLAFVAFIPFSAGLLAEHLDEPFAVAFYAGAQVLTTMAQTLVWIYATRLGHLVPPDLEPGLVLYVTLRGVLTIALFALSIPLAWVSTELATFSWVLIPLGFFVLNRLLRIGRAEGAADPFADSAREG